MKTEIRKRQNACTLLWTIFVALKWIMLLSPSSILSKFSPLMVILQDERDDYVTSGWISLCVETALIGVFFIISRKKIIPLYLLCLVYSLLYVPTLVYWAATLEYEVWRYMQFVPAVGCAAFLIAGCLPYFKQEKLFRPTSKPQHTKEPESEPEKEENE